MRKVIVALLSVLVAGLMLIPSSASAGTVASVLKDARGDLGPKLDFSTGEVLLTWPDEMVLKKVGYFDALSFSLSYSTREKTYTFSMEVAKALPAPGTALPYGWKVVRWLMWIDPEPWIPGVNDPTIYSVLLEYDGSVYSAQLRDYATGAVLEELPFEIDGSTFQVEFSPASIGNMASFWWLPCTVVVWSASGIGGYWDLDAPDPGAAPGQVLWDVPWPPA